MKKFVFAFLILFFVKDSFGQSKNKVSLYLQTEYNHTVYDRTLGNNPWSVGLGLQSFLLTKSKLKPTIELAADGSLEDDKVLRLNLENKAVNDAKAVINLFGGLSFFATKNVYVSFVAGPSFINSETYFGIKPSVGFYFSKTQKVTGRVTYTNIFNREFNYEHTQKDDFGSIGFAIGIKLF